MRSLALAIAFILCGVAGVNAAERVPVRDGLHADYGRIVFDWPSEVGYEAGIEAGRLVVTFAEPGDFEGSLMRAGLPGYATAPQVSEDGRRLSLRLDGAVALKHFRIGSKVVQDRMNLIFSAFAQNIEGAIARPVTGNFCIRDPGAIGIAVEIVAGADRKVTRVEIDTPVSQFSTTGGGRCGFRRFFVVIGKCRRCCGNRE